MKKNKIILFIIHSLLLSTIFISCSTNVLQKALDKGIEALDTGNKNDVQDFTCEQIPGSLDVSLSWKNPTQSNFSSVLIVRKQNEFPLGYNDSNATTVYSGNLESTTDSQLSANTLYYYTIYTINSNGLYSPGIKKIIEMIPITEIYSEDVANVSINQVIATSSVNITWTNPTAVSFSTVTIVKSLNYFPNSINSPLSSIVYEGNAESFNDTTVDVNRIYYYTLFTKSLLNKYSSGKKVNIEIIQQINIYPNEVSNFIATQTPATINASLTWTNPVDSDFNSVLVLRKTGTFPSSATDATATTMYTGSLTTFTDSTALVNTVYYYSVYTKNTANKFSLGTKAVLEIVPLNTIYSVEVSAFTVTQPSGTINASLTWTNPVDSDFDSVLVLRKTGAFPSSATDTTATTVYTGNLTTYTDTTALVNTVYYYSIYTKSTANKFSLGTKAVLEIVPLNTIYSVEVSAFTVTQASGTINASLTWTNPVDSDFDSVLVLRKAGTFPSSATDTTATSLYTGSLTTFTDSTALVNTVYYYSVYTKSTTNKFSLGTKATLEIVPLNTIYSVEVSAFTVTQPSGTINASLTWTNPVDSDFDSVLVLRKAGTFPSSATDTTATSLYSGNLTTFTDSTALVNTVYYYSVYTKNTANKFSLGTKAVLEIVPLNTIYSVEVSAFTVTQPSGTINASLTWTNPVDSDFDSVLVLRKTGAFPSSATDATATTLYAGSLTTYTDSTTLVNTVYYYSIYTKNTSKNYYSLGVRKSIEITSSPNIISTNLEIVSNFNSVVSDSSIELSWINPTADFSGVLIKRKADSYPSAYNDASATTIYENNGTTYSDTTGLTNNTTYYYSIFVKNSSALYSQYSSRTFKTFRTDFTPTVRQRCFYLIGGSSNYSAPFTNLVSQIDAYDPVTDIIYDNVATLPTPRYGCTVSSTNGKIYIFGGLDSNKKLVAKVDVLFVSSPIWPSNVWSTIQDYPAPKFMARSENVNGNIYVFGGSSDFYGTTTSPATYLNFATYFITNEISMYNPQTETWVVDRKYVPLMAGSLMNFGSGVYEGNIFYGAGRYTTAGALSLGTGAFLLNLNTFISQAALVGTFVPSAAAGNVMYQKKAVDGTDIAFFLHCGGTTTASTSEPIRAVAANLAAVTTCKMIRFPLSTGATAPTWINFGAVVKTLLTARAYNQAEYYGDSIYTFCGITSPSGVVLNSVEKINVDDALTFPTGWGSVGTGGTLSPRYAFDITKINN
ncbi:MAG: hypothetical protein A2Y30_00925 [Spirochaetes bacterium GWE1_32_154]|nr:MAG: hypothetical protein A2Y30_00925 [Spirochaetes bacterium GWE1_32_154]